MVARDIRSLYFRSVANFKNLNLRELELENQKIFEKIWDNVEDSRAMTSCLLRTDSLKLRSINLHLEKNISFVSYSLSTRKLG